MIYAVMLADTLLVSGIVLIVFWMRKRKKQRKNKPDMEVFRGSPEKLERSIKERSRPKIVLDSICEDYAPEEYLRREDLFKHTGRSDGNNLMRERLGRNKDESEGICQDLAEQSARSFEHGGLNMNSDITNYFNI